MKTIDIAEGITFTLLVLMGGSFISIHSGVIIGVAIYEGITISGYCMAMITGKFWGAIVIMLARRPWYTAFYTLLLQLFRFVAWVILAQLAYEAFPWVILMAIVVGVMAFIPFLYLALYMQGNAPKSVYAEVRERQVKLANVSK